MALYILFVQSKKKKPLCVDKQCHLGRTCEDFLEHTEFHSDITVAEMYSVEGKKAGETLLTLFFRNSNLMIVCIWDNNLKLKGEFYGRKKSI